LPVASPVKIAQSLAFGTVLGLSGTDEEGVNNLKGAFDSGCGSAYQAQSAARTSYHCWLKRGARLSEQSSAERERHWRAKQLQIVAEATLPLLEGPACKNEISENATEPNALKIAYMRRFAAQQVII
jgi:hypothetical protein